MICGVGAQSDTWKLDFETGSEIDCNGMIFAYTACKRNMEPISWIGVSMMCVITSVKFHGHTNCVAMGSFGRRRIGRNLAYKGGGGNIAQMDLTSKDEM